MLKNKGRGSRTGVERLPQPQWIIILALVAGVTLLLFLLLLLVCVGASSAVVAMRVAGVASCRVVLCRGIGC